MGSLVTGIGYIGARLAQMLLDSGEPVVGLDNLFSTDPSAVRRLADYPAFTFVSGNVADEEAVQRAFDSGGPIHTVYHLAAQASSHPSAAPVRFTEETNLIGPRVAMEQACMAGASTFVFGGSIQVYGRTPLGVVDESTPYGPILDIAHLSKLYVEKLMEMHARTRGLRCVSARLGLVYGLSPVMKTDPRFMTAPNKFCRQAALGEPIRIDASAFHPTGMVHVDDAARALMALARWPEDGFSAVNVVGETASVAEVGMLVRRLAAERGLQVEMDLPPRAAAPERAVSFRSALSGAGFAPRCSLQRDLAPVLDYFLGEERGPHPRPLSPWERRDTLPSLAGKEAGGLGSEGATP